MQQRTGRDADRQALDQDLGKLATVITAKYLDQRGCIFATVSGRLCLIKNTCRDAKKFRINPCFSSVGLSVLYDTVPDVNGDIRISEVVRHDGVYDLDHTIMTGQDGGMLSCIEN